MPVTTSAITPPTSSTPATISGTVVSAPVAASVGPSTATAADDATSTPATVNTSGNEPARCDDGTVNDTDAAPAASDMPDATTAPSNTTENARDAGRPATDAETESPALTDDTEAEIEGEKLHSNDTKPVPEFVDATPVKPSERKPEPPPPAPTT